MSEYDDKELLDAVNVLCENLSISKDDIYYIRLKNGEELMCEFCDYEAVTEDFDVDEEVVIDVNDDTHRLMQSDTHEIAFFPLSIKEESFISSDGSFVSHKYFTVFNEYNNDIFQPIDKTDISLKSQVTNSSALIDYLTGVAGHYYMTDLTINISTEPQNIINPTGNVVDFDKYFTRRKMKQF
jgi:hypothetical protein